MLTRTRQVGGVTIVDSSGRIQLGGESAALRDLVCDLQAGDPRRFCLILAMTIILTAQVWANWSALNRHSVRFLETNLALYFQANCG
jgi:hypothetical protein